MKLLVAALAVTAVLSAADAGGIVCATKMGQVAQAASHPQSSSTVRCTDAQGKKWMYRQTPFGVARWADVPAASPASTPNPAAGVKAAEAGGGVILFERQGPFGVYKWQKNKSELTEAERAICDKQLAKTPAN